MKSTITFIYCIVCFLSIGAGASGFPSQENEKIPRQGRHDNDHGPECPFPFTDVNDKCLYANCNPNPAVSYTVALSKCSSLGSGSSLATYDSGNEYASILSYLKEIDPPSSANQKGTCSYWVGGSDVTQEGIWRWYNGELVPRGVPFWATSGTTVFPTVNVNTGFNYALLSNNYYWATVDTNDQSQLNSVPLCEYKRPIRHREEGSGKKHHRPTSYPYFPYFPFYNPFQGYGHGNSHGYGHSRV